MINLNHFYTCRDHLLLFPTKELVQKAAHWAIFKGGHTLADEASEEAEYWNSRLENCKASYSEKNSTFLVLEKQAVYIKVLFKDKVGWVCYNWHLYFKEVTCDND